MEIMWRENFLFYLSLTFIVGNLLSVSLIGRFSDGIPILWISIFCAAAACVCISLIVLKRTRHPVLSLALFFFLGWSGVALFEQVRIRREDSVLLRSVGMGRVEVRGIVEETGLTKKGRPFAELSLGQEKTLIYFNKDISVVSEAGDTLVCVVRVNEVVDFTEGFDYVRYMAEKGIFATCFQWKGAAPVVGHCPSPELRYRIRRWRYGLEKYLRRMLLPQGDAVMSPGDSVVPAKSDADRTMGLSEENFALVQALAYGDKGGISEETKAAFRDSGTIHLFALSGMHVGIIYGIMAFLLSIMGNSTMAKIVRSIIIVSALWSYAVFTGLASSITRAVLMATVYEFGKLMERKNNGLNALGFSALIISSFDPYAPSEPGFQLSYTAMLGIFIIFPQLRKIADPAEKSLESIILEEGVGRRRCAVSGRWPKPILRLWELLAISVSCQIFTAPLTWYYFQTYSDFSLLANLLCGTTTSVVMPLIPISVSMHGVPYLGHWPVWLLDMLLSFMRYVSEVISAF